MPSPSKIIQSAKALKGLLDDDIVPAVKNGVSGLLDIVDEVPTKFKESFNEGYGKKIESPYGYISVLSDGPYSPRKHSVTSFVVDEAQRGKGYGQKLIDEVLRQYPTDIGAQVSSPASAKAFYNKGFRLAADPNASIDDIFNAINDYSSAYMVK